jgi:hypothetical protein
VIEIEALAPSTLISPDERWEPVSLDGGDYLSKPETRRSAALRWFIDTLALAGAAMAGVYVGDWLDPSNVSGKRTDGKGEPRRDSAALRPLAMMQTDGRLIESFRLSATKTAGIFTTPVLLLLRGRTDGARKDRARPTGPEE